MGKIRVKEFGDEASEQESKEKSEKKREAKKLAKVPGGKGGERLKVVGPTEEELDAEEKAQNKTQEAPEETAKPKKKMRKDSKKRVRSKKYSSKITSVDRNKTYPLKEALELLSGFDKAGFDESVELHINITEGGVSGNMTLPHGTGKKTRVVEATDELIAEIEKGKIGFDILVAKPEMMPKLAKVAKVLGPRGLMPNPKAGTITDKPEDIIKKFEGGLINFKSETKAPIVHLMVGKVSLGADKLTENINTAIKAINAGKIRNATLKSTMSPGIKIVI